jgi:hypothetical protein
LRFDSLRSLIPRLRSDDPEPVEGSGHSPCLWPAMSGPAARPRAADGSLANRSSSRSSERRWPANRSSSPSSERRLERETGIEPATNSLEGCDSTTELLPPSSSLAGAPRPARVAPLAGPPTPRAASRPPPSRALRRASPPQEPQPRATQSLACHPKLVSIQRAKDGRPPKLVRRTAARLRHGYGGQPSRALMSEGWWGGEGSNLRSR